MLGEARAAAKPAERRPVRYGSQPAAASAATQWRTQACGLRTHAPRSRLFLCVANSARSQLAEGIAHELTPAKVQTSCAGFRARRDERLRRLHAVFAGARS